MAAQRNGTKRHSSNVAEIDTYLFLMSLTRSMVWFSLKLEVAEADAILIG